MVEMIGNFNKILSLCFLVILVCGCQKDSIEDGEFIATMGVPGGDTKSYISNMHNCWEATDKVWVNGAPAEEFQLDADLGMAHFKPAARAESYKMFTYGGEPFTWSGSTVTFSLAENYTGQDMPMYAITDDFGPVEFKNIFSVIHFKNIPKNGNNKIQLEAYSTITTSWGTTSGETPYNRISGDFSVDFSGETPTMSGGTSNTRTITVPEGKTEVWMVIPAVASNVYFFITITNRGDSYEKYNRTTFPANYLRTVDYNNITDCVLVDNRSQLNEQLNNVANKYIRLTGDIDFREYGGYNHKLWGSLTTLKIEGDGHSLIIDRPIYDKLGVQAKVYNLTLKGTFTSSYNGAFANGYWSLAEIFRGTISGDNYSSEVLYNGNPVPFAP